MKQYNFDKNSILISISEPHINPKYDPYNPKSTQYRYNPRTSLLVSQEIEIPEGHTLKRNGDLIETVKDLRGQAAWVKDTAEKFFLDYAGELKTEHTFSEPSQNDVWDYEADSWIDGRDIEETRDSACQQIKTHFKAVFNKRIGKVYPEFEAGTFEDQLKDAVAWATDNSVETPFLDLILGERNKAELVEDILFRAAEKKRISADVLFEQYAALDRLKACTTLEQIDALMETL